MYLHSKNRPVSLQKRRKMSCFHHFQVFTEFRFQNVPVRAPFSKSTVFKICWQNMCRFRVNGRPIRRIFQCFQNLPASCECGIRLYQYYWISVYYNERHLRLIIIGFIIVFLLFIRILFLRFFSFSFFCLLLQNDKSK